MVERFERIVEPRSAARVAYQKPLLSPEKPRSPRRLGGVRGRIAVVGLTAVAAFTGGSLLSQGSGRPSTESPSSDNTIGLVTPDPIQQHTSLEFAPMIIFQSTPEPARTESKLENEIEEEFNIEILDVREAYKALGRDFNIYDEYEFGNHPPTRWSKGQLMLLKRSLPKLPSKLYSPDGDGKLSLALTSYGKDCSCSGTFHEGGSSGGDIIFLEDNIFRADQGINPLKTLTHELTHGPINNMEMSLWPKVMEILGFSSFQEAREYFLPKLNKAYKKGFINSSTYYSFNYGFMGIYKDGLHDPRELIAIMAETYIVGPEEFMQTSAFLGQEKARRLYRLVGEELFDGYKYKPGPDGLLVVIKNSDKSSKRASTGS